MDQQGKAPELLPDELLWADGGHASDVVLTSLADGQHAIVPLAVSAHVERCPACMAHLGHSALLSLETRRLMSEAHKRQPVPRLAVLFGLAAAVIGLIPRLVEGPSTSRQVSLVTRALATFATRLHMSGSSTLGITLTYVTAACFVLAGLMLARFSSKKEVSSS